MGRLSTDLFIDLAEVTLDLLVVHFVDCGRSYVVFSILLSQP
jgi:hypothetical protein